MSNASTVLPRFLPFYFYTFSILFSQYPYYNYYNYPNDMFAYLLSSMVPSISYKNYITFNVSKELTFAPYKDKNQLGLHLTLRQMMYSILSYAPVVVLFLAIVIMIKLLREFRTEIVFLCEVMLFFRINKNARKRKNKFFLSHYIVSFYLLLA